MRKTGHKSTPTAPAWCALPVALGVLGGCNTCDPNDEQVPASFEGGTTDRDAGVYETASVGEDYLPFGPGQSYRLRHDLGGTPRGLSAFLAISACPLCEDAEVDYFASAAGNEVVWESVDAEEVVVRNDTCGDFFVRVVLSLPDRR